MKILIHCLLIICVLFFVWSCISSGLEAPHVDTNMSSDRLVMSLVSIFVFAIPTFALASRLKMSMWLTIVFFGVFSFFAALLFSHIMTAADGGYPTIEAPLWVFLD